MKIKMLIGLDEEKIKADGIYDVAELWHILDGMFMKEGCYREDTENGVMYTATEDEYLMGKMWIMLGELEETDWFKQYCNDWLYIKQYKGDDMLYCEDCLMEQWGCKSLSNDFGV